MVHESSLSAGVVQADCGIRIVWLYSVRAQHTHTLLKLESVLIGMICTYIVANELHPTLWLPCFSSLFQQNNTTSHHAWIPWTLNSSKTYSYTPHPKITRFKNYWAYMGHVANFIKFSANTQKEKLIYGMSLDRYIYTMIPTPYRLYNTSCWSYSRVGEAKYF